MQGYSKAKPDCTLGITGVLSHPVHPLGRQAPCQSMRLLSYGTLV